MTVKHALCKSMPSPVNKQLYAQVKREIYTKYPKHSAYRSGLLVQEYKRRGGTYRGKQNKDEGLTHWFASEWKNQRGEVGYKFKSDVYRPTVRVNSKTPATFSELTPSELKRARREKATTGRVKQFTNSQ